MELQVATLESFLDALLSDLASSKAPLDLGATHADGTLRGSLGLVVALVLLKHSWVVEVDHRLVFRIARDNRIHDRMHFLHLAFSFFGLRINVSLLDVIWEALVAARHRIQALLKDMALLSSDRPSFFFKIIIKKYKDSTFEIFVFSFCFL